MIMKRIILALTALLCLVLPSDAMSYEQARREAFFLTDKMAYELNLTQEQYDAAYEINLDYLMGVTTVDDVFSTYWKRRNLDMSYILLQWQWDAFCAATYFYRPLYWADGFWHFAIYARYPRRNYFYFSRPTVYITYRGGHSWRSNGGRSYYHAHRDHYRRPAPHGSGMRDRWDRGEFRGKRYAGSSGSHSVTTRPGNTTRPTGNSFGGSRKGGTFSANRNGNSGSTATTPVRRPSSSSSFSQKRSASAGTTGSTTKRTGTSGSNSTLRTPTTSNRANIATGSMRSGSFRNRAGSNSAGSSNRLTTATPLRSSSSSSNRSGSFRSASGRSSISTSRTAPSRSSSGSGSGSPSRSGGFSGRR